MDQVLEKRLKVTTVALTLIAVVLVGLPLVYQGAIMDEWTNATETRIAAIKGPAPDIGIEVSGSGSTYTVNVRYDRMNQARVSVYMSPFKPGIFPYPMTRFYDMVEWGPVTHTFTVGGCGEVFVAVNDAFTGEGSWVQLPRRTVCQ